MIYFLLMIFVFKLNNTVVRMVTQSFEVSSLSFSLPSTTMASIQITMAGNCGRWCRAPSPPLTIFEGGIPAQQITYHWKGNLSKSSAHFQQTKCFGFAILWAIFAKLPKFRPFLGVGKNNKCMKHKHVIYHFTARDLEIMNICFAKYSNLANLRRPL